MVFDANQQKAARDANREVIQAERERTDSLETVNANQATNIFDLIQRMGSAETVNANQSQNISDLITRMNSTETVNVNQSNNIASNRQDLNDLISRMNSVETVNANQSTNIQGLRLDVNALLNFTSRAAGFAGDPHGNEAHRAAFITQGFADNTYSRLGHTH